jgi:membrane protease YdiL (CAAX protease family)
MARTLFLAVLLAGVMALLSQALQRRVQDAMRRAPARIWLVPPALTAVFLLASALMESVNWELVLIVGLYTSAPVACAWFAGVGPARRPVVLDFAAIALLWFPLEFPAGAGRLIAKHAQGFLHSVAYGIAIVLGLAIFLCFRQVEGMKYRLPESVRDWRNMLIGFAVTAPILAVVGIPIGFIPMPHSPTASMERMATAAVIIFCATALPEEILFRSMIQNLMFQRFGATTRTLVAASLIFGAAHLDNGPQAVPNWRYFILATIAGFAYGKVFQRSSSVLASTGFHAMVDWTKHFFF